MEEKKFDCYKCKHRRTIPGDAHSACYHPKVNQDDNMFGAIADMVAGKSNKAWQELNIQGHPQGIRSGWFMWPVNFDPTWLLNCDGFEPKEEESTL